MIDEFKIQQKKIEFEGEVEEELSWRKSELSLLKSRLISNDNNDINNDKFRKALIVTLYSHFEGFTKKVLELYTTTLNSFELGCHEVNYAIASASVHDLFTMLNSAKKHDEFSVPFPDDTKLHQFYRRLEFIKDFDNFAAKKIDIPDGLISTEGNLSPSVFRKLLYLLGLDLRWVDSDISIKIDILLKYRNNIAHGVQRAGVDETKYEELEQITIYLMTKLNELIIKNMKNNEYLK